MNVAATRYAQTATGGEQVKDNGVLGRDAFMKLLVAQLQHQDPIEPMKDQEFAAQLAQFNSLEAVQNLSEQFKQFVNLQMWSAQMGQATGMIGRTVDLMVDDAIVTGQVSAVRIVDGTIAVVVDGEAYNIELVREVRA